MYYFPDENHRFSKSRILNIEPYECVVDYFIDMYVVIFIRY